MTIYPQISPVRDLWWSDICLFSDYRRQYLHNPYCRNVKIFIHASAAHVSESALPMKTSYHWNAFRITGPLCGETTRTVGFSSHNLFYIQIGTCFSLFCFVVLCFVLLWSYHQFSVYPCKPITHVGRIVSQALEQSYGYPCASEVTLMDMGNQLVSRLRTWITLIPAWISNYIDHKMWVGRNCLSIPKLQRCNRWSLGMDK